VFLCREVCSLALLAIGASDRALIVFIEIDFLNLRNYFGNHFPTSCSSSTGNAPEFSWEAMRHQASHYRVGKNAKILRKKFLPGHTAITTPDATC